jgi:hypothetical protein
LKPVLQKTWTADDKALYFLWVSNTLLIQSSLLDVSEYFFEEFIFLALHLACVVALLLGDGLLHLASQFLRLLGAQVNVSDAFLHHRANHGSTHCLLIHFSQFFYVDEVELPFNESQRLGTLNVDALVCPKRYVLVFLCHLSIESQQVSFWVVFELTNLNEKSDFLPFIFDYSSVGLQLDFSEGSRLHEVSYTD